jgi:hypothetical protein
VEALGYQCQDRRYIRINVLIRIGSGDPGLLKMTIAASDIGVRRIVWFYT